MTDVVLFHSILGLREAERRLARTFEADGHTVILPDMFGGQTTEDYDEGFAIMKRIGAAEIEARRRDALARAPRRSVLAGISFGAFGIGEVWDELPESPGALFYAGFSEWMEPRRPGFKLQAHIAQPDPFDPEEVFDDWAGGAGAVDLTLFRYPGAGHFFLDETLSDYHAPSAALCLERSRQFLASF